MENNLTSTIPIRRPVSQAVPTPPVSVVEEPKYPTEVIPFPSRGWFYPEENPLSSGEIEIKMMTAKEEDILTNENYVKKNIVFDKLLRSLVIDKTVDISDLLVMDHDAIMLAARRLAYGDSYKVKISCPRCDFENNAVIDLSKINYKEVDLEKFPKGINSFEFQLPFSKKVVKFKSLTNKDSEMMSKDIENHRKANKDDVSLATTRLKYMIVSIDGDDDRNVIRRFVDNEMLARDAMALRKYSSDILPSLDSSFNFECSNCSNVERMDVPFTVRFFWPEE